MRVPPEHKKDRYDDAYATGFVVASGNWGSDVLTVQHAIDGAWRLRVTIANRWKAPAQARRFKSRSRPRAAPHAAPKLAGDFARLVVASAE